MIYEFKVIEDEFKGDLDVLRVALEEAYDPQYTNAGIGHYEANGVCGVDNDFTVELKTYQDNIIVKFVFTENMDNVNIAFVLYDIDEFIKDVLDLGDREYDSNDLCEIDEDDYGKGYYRKRAPKVNVTATFRVTANHIKIEKNIVSFNIGWSNG